jgi:YHS domain-containing protein
MKYLIVLILVALVIRYLFKKIKAPQVTKPTAEVLRQDPVCGAYVPEQREFSLRTGGGRVYFCSRECMNKFKENTPS